MSVKAGSYFFGNAGKHGNFVGIGPIPRIYPTLATPLRPVHSLRKDVFEVKPAENDQYKLRAYQLWVGYDKDGNMALLPQGQEAQAWCIEDVGRGIYRIKLPDSDQYLTMSNSENMIRLEDRNDGSEQEWKFSV